MFAHKFSAVSRVVHRCISSARVVDLRSDVLTKPSSSMKAAMVGAALGDDVFGECPTTLELEHKCAELFGMEAALFLPSGTMANVLAVMTHSAGRGQEVLVGDRSHMFMHATGGLAHIAGVQPRVLHNLADGSFNMADLKHAIRDSHDCHQPTTSVICIENTHNMCGGTYLSHTFLEHVGHFAKKLDLPVHVDGARIYNAAIATGEPVSHLLKDCSSVSMCFSKGLGTPVGSVLGGNSAFISRARRLRKMIGGGMRQPGVLAAAALVALQESPALITQDHRRTQHLLTHIVTLGEYGIFEPAATKANTNILIVPVRSKHSAHHVCDMLQRGDVCLKTLVYGHSVRFVIYRDITDEDIHLACEKLTDVCQKLAIRGKW